MAYVTYNSDGSVKAVTGKTSTKLGQESLASLNKTSSTSYQQPISGVGSAAETNRLLGGNYFNPTTGSVVQAFTQQDAKANAKNYTNATNIGTPAIGFPPKPTATDPGGMVGANNTALAGFSTTTANPLTMLNGQMTLTPPTPTGDKVQDSQAMDLYNLTAQAVGMQAANKPASDEKIFENTYGISADQARESYNKDRAEVNQHAASLNRIVQQGEMDKMSIIGQGKGIPQDILNNEAIAITRRVAMESLPVQAQLAAAQGNLDESRRHLDQLFELRVKDAETDFKWKSGVIDTVMQYASKAEQRKFDRLKEVEAADHAEHKDFLKTQNELLLSAVTQKAPSSVIDAINKAATMGEAIQAAGEYGADILERQAKELALQNTRSLINERNTKTGLNGPSSGVSGITQSVIDNPSLFDDLTPTVRGSVIDELQRAGYETTNLGQKGLSDTAIKEVAQTQKALDDLSLLKDKIAGNEQYIGPLKGLQRLNPYSKARQIQADVDRVRQTVGKALEGGVLRKEDEEKYKKILATLSDTPETATYKIDALVSSIQRDIATYKSLQQSSGRSMDVNASLQKKGTATKPEDLRTIYHY